MSTRLAVFGFGNMGQAVIDGSLRAGLLRASEILVVDPDPTKLATAAHYGCLTSPDPASARSVMQVLLAVKPQSFASLAPALGQRLERTIFTSVMAGIQGARILNAINDRIDHAVIRAMPNTPCKFGVGITGLALSAGARDGDDLFARSLFDAVGTSVRVDESMLDAVTAVSASGPAYLFLLAEAWEEGAVALGFERTTARELVRQTIAGASRMLEDRSIDARDLRAAVTSKGGTTAAAIAVLEGRGLQQAMRDALAAAEARGRELGAG